MYDIPFFKPSIDDSELNQIKEVLNQTDKNKTGKLEENFSNYIQTNHSISTSSGTAAMHLSMMSIDLKRGDKIVCSVNAFPSVAEVVRHFDAEPIFVDIDKDDFNIDPLKLDEVLTKSKHKKLKAVFVSHVAGQPAPMDEIYEVADKHGVLIIEDASNAMGAVYKGKKIGSLPKTTLTTFSFSPHSVNNVINAGMIATNEEMLDKRARLLRNHAIVSEAWEKYGDLDYVYDVVDIGVKYDLSQLDAAFCIAQLAKNDSFIKRRQDIAAIYDKELANVPHVSTPVKKRDHIYKRYIIKIDKNRDSFARELAAKNIHTGLNYIPIHLLSYYKSKYNLRINDFPVALTNYQQILSLPIYPSLSDDEVMYVCEQVKSVAKTRV
ncbi:MAG: DegT/DnrJ/EryC1/StrS family aminotransferase [Epsilonproteobacteria bacterium]|nr:DegT/DnrJ/EryC1/StrS family aminotransferase [Campylobacterota bacterium]